MQPVQIVKTRDGYVNFDNVTRVRVWTTPDGQCIAEICFHSLGERDTDAANQRFQLTGREAEALVDWLDGQKEVDLTRLQREQAGRAKARQ
jgi:hypothetical protein